MVMTPELLGCPYCNAQVPRPLTGGTVVCPRCGESLPRRAAPPKESIQQTTATNMLAAPPGPVAPRLDSPNARPRLTLSVQLAFLSVSLVLVSLLLKIALPDSNTTQRSLPFMVLLCGIGLLASLWLWFFSRPRANSTIAIFVLGNMVSMAVMVLPFALATIAFRRDHDPKGADLGPEPSTTSTLESVAPAMLGGLGYLPDSCNLVAGVHVAELLAQPIGAKLLERPQAGGGEQPPWPVDLALGPVEKWTGLKAAELDHVVLGTHIDLGLPHLTIVVRTLKPYDPLALEKARAPQVPVQYLNRNLYQFSPPPGMLFCADPRTLVLVLRLDALAERDKQLLTAAPRTGTKGPPAPVRTIVQQRLSKGTLIWWAATEVERPEVVGALMPLAQQEKELAKLLVSAKSVVGGLQLQNDAAVVGAVECQDASTGRSLAALVEKQRLEGLGSPKVFGPPTDSNDSWVTFQVRGSPEAVAAALRPVRLLGRNPGKR
jgi:hypothetical protein